MKFNFIYYFILFFFFLIIFFLFFFLQIYIYIYLLTMEIRYNKNFIDCMMLYEKTIFIPHVLILYSDFPYGKSVI